MKVTKTRKIDAVIPTASMADIAFLLIVFFMISTVFQVDKTNVKPPTSAAITREKIIKGSAFIIIKDDGTIKASDGEEESQLVNIEDIGVITSAWMQKSPSQPVVIKADTTAKYGLIDDVVQQLREAGVVNLMFLTDQTKQH